jgi:hypothetical protein
MCLQVKDYKDNIRAYMDACRKLSKEVGIPFWAQEGGYNHSMPGSRVLQYGMGWMPDKSVNPTAIYACYLNSASPTFTVKLVTKLTTLAQEEHVKRASSAKITFQRASRAAASLRRLQLAVHSTSIIHEPKTGRGELDKPSILSARSDSAVIDASRKMAVSDAGLENVSGSAEKPKEKGPRTSGAAKQQKDEWPKLVSPWDRAAEGVPVEDENGTSSTMQSCVNNLVTYFSMFVDGAVYALYRDPSTDNDSASENSSRLPAASNGKPADDHQGKFSNGSVSHTTNPALAESVKRLKEKEAQREKERELVKIVPSVAPVGGLFAHVKDAPKAEVSADGQRLSFQTASSKDRLSQSKLSSSTSVFGQKEVENESAEVQLNYYLLTSGIRNVIVGHQPRGDAPLILDSDDGLKVP